MSDQAESARTRSCTRLLYIPARMKIAPTIRIPITIRGVMFPPKKKSLGCRGQRGRYHTEIELRKLPTSNNQQGTSLPSSDYGNMEFCESLAMRVNILVRYLACKPLSVYKFRRI